MKPCSLPLGVEHRALGGHFDVLGDLRDDLVVPDALGEAAERLGFVLLDRLQRIACVHRGLLVVGVGFSVSSQAVSTPKTSSCSGSLKISWKSDANGRAVTTAAGAAAANAALPAGTTSGRCRRRAAASAPASAAPRARTVGAGVGEEADQARRDPVVDERIGAVGGDDRRRRARCRSRRGRCRRRGWASAPRASRATPLRAASCRCRAPATTARAHRRRAARPAAATRARRRRSARRPGRRGCGRAGRAAGRLGAHGVDDRAPGRRAGRRRRRAGRARPRSRRGRAGRSRRRSSRLAFSRAATCA